MLLLIIVIFRTPETPHRIQSPIPMPMYDILHHEPVVDVLLRLLSLQLETTFVAAHTPLLAVVLVVLVVLVLVVDVPSATALGATKGNPNASFGCTLLTTATLSQHRTERECGTG